MRRHSSTTINIMNTRIRKPKTPLLVGAVVASCLASMGSIGSAPAPPIPLNEIHVDPQTGLVSLSWDSQRGRSYLIEESPNPSLLRLCRGIAFA